MKTHNAYLYHCLNCGNVIHSERRPQPPRCCGHEMILAAAETICDREESLAGQPAEAHCETAAPAADERR